MDTEPDNNVYEPQPSSLSNSSSSSSSNLPMLPIMHDDPNAEDDNDERQGDMVPDFGTIHTTDHLVMNESSIIFNSHMAPTSNTLLLSSSASTSPISATSLQQLQQQLQLQQQHQLEPSQPQQQPPQPQQQQQQQHNQSSMHDAPSSSAILSTTTYPPPNPDSPSPQQIQAINQLSETTTPTAIATTTTTTSNILFANASNTEHLHYQQPHTISNSPAHPQVSTTTPQPPPQEPPSSSLPLTVHQQQQQQRHHQHDDGDDEEAGDVEAYVADDDNLVEHENDNNNIIALASSSSSLSTHSTNIDANAIADTIDASAIVVPEHESIDVDPDIVEDVDNDNDNNGDDNRDDGDREGVADDDIYDDIVDPDDENIASTSQQAGIRSGATTASSPPTATTTTLPLLLQAAATDTTATSANVSTDKQHEHHTGGSRFYCGQAFAHPQLTSYNALPPHQPYYGATGNVFNFDTNGISMYGQPGDGGPHSSNAAAAAAAATTSASTSQTLNQQTTAQPVVDRLKVLYPNVNESETPLPRCWSPHEKCLSIGLSQNNLRVHYKGTNKPQNDAASVRTPYPIPPACGLYYFEVKIISKGKNGYMGIGLTAQQFRMNRLPGWDKQSYGYHGDDGNSFSSSGNGQTYGPTFTTGDVIGCCVNFVNNTCFYTKNGVDLGIAFRDLPTKLYPTVGLQMPGEEVDANFGQEPFKFDRIECMMKQMREEMKVTIYNFPMSHEHGDQTSLLHKMVTSYLVHNGYSQTAEAFARSTGQTFDEDMPSIRNRQRIIKLAMCGKMGQAIEQTLRSYPGLLESNKNLWFMLKCRQFIEMINGSDVENCIDKSTNTTITTQTTVIQSTKCYKNGKRRSTNNTITAVINTDNHQQQPQQQQELKNTNISAENDNCNTINKSNESLNDGEYPNDIEMENNGHSNGNSCKNGEATFFNAVHDMDEDMDVEMSPATRKYSHMIERILEFGKELSQMGQQLERENKMTDEERQMLEDAFSLIAYSNPWTSPLGWQLCPTRREQVCTALNSAILESLSYPRRPPLDICVSHAAELLKVMAQSSLGACAFVNIEDVFPQN